MRGQITLEFELQPDSDLSGVLFGARLFIVGILPAHAKTPIQLGGEGITSSGGGGEAAVVLGDIETLAVD